MITKKTITKNLSNTLNTVNIDGLGKKYQGKVRDFYVTGGKRILITTDRQSAFNYNLGLVPFTGQVLNLLSKFWFTKTNKIIPNHMISVPHPNVMITHDCKPIPIEMVVRGYLSGVTVTSPWYNYQKGVRVIYGIKFPDGLKKNDRLSTPIITPTSHPDPTSGSHDDERLTRAEILKSKLVSPKIYMQMEQTALKLFAYGTRICAKAGLILVDTKYEFGLYQGKLMLIDEIHTPDSSRFWVAKTYKQRLKQSKEPDNFDKEFLRLYYRTKLGYQGTGQPLEMPKNLTIDLAQRYRAVFEKLTQRKFTPSLKPSTEKSINRYL